MICFFCRMRDFAGSPSNVCQPRDFDIICRVKSGQTTIQLCQRRAWVDNVRHHLGLGHRSTGPSLLDAISFNTSHSGWTMHYRNELTLTILYTSNIDSKRTNLHVKVKARWRQILGSCINSKMFASGTSANIARVGALKTVDISNRQLTTQIRIFAICLLYMGWQWSHSVHNSKCCQCHFGGMLYCSNVTS